MIGGNERVGLNEFFCLNPKMLMRDEDRDLHQFIWYVLMFRYWRSSCGRLEEGQDIK